MGVPFFDLMKYGLGLASIATAPAQQAVMLAQRLAGLGMEPEPEQEPEQESPGAEVALEPAPPAPGKREAA